MHFESEEEGTIIFRKVGELHQSTCRDIQEDLNVPKLHSDKLKSHKYLGRFIIFGVKFIYVFEDGSSNIAEK